MRKIMMMGTGLSVALLMAACSGETSEPAATETQAASSDMATTMTSETPAEAPAMADAAAGAADGKPQAFNQCAVCHSPEKGKNGVGPSLAGVFGAKAGARDIGYNYSDAMKGFGKTWDEATLDAYLKSPMAVVPGTRMTFPGMAKDEDRKAVIAYLKTLK